MCVLYCCYQEGEETTHLRHCFVVNRWFSWWTFYAETDGSGCQNDCELCGEVDWVAEVDAWGFLVCLGCCHFFAFYHFFCIFLELMWKLCSEYNDFLLNMFLIWDKISGVCWVELDVLDFSEYVPKFSQEWLSKSKRRILFIWNCRKTNKNVWLFPINILNTKMKISLRIENSQTETLKRQLSI